MNNLHEQISVFTRRMGHLNAACCDECCGEQVSMIQSHILAEVRRLEIPSMQRVAGELGMDVTTFSRQAKTLEEKGLLSRRVSRDDRRVFLLGLTAEGALMLERIDRFMAQRLEQVFAGMTPFELESVVRSLGLLNGVLTHAGFRKKVECCK